VRKPRLDTLLTQRKARTKEVRSGSCLAASPKADASRRGRHRVRLGGLG
jgi:hypothetical protein